MESEERGAPGPLYLRALGFSTTRAQLPQKPHKTRTGGFALRAKKEFAQSSRFAFHPPPCPLWGGGGMGLSVRAGADAP